MVVEGGARQAATRHLRVQLQTARQIAAEAADDEETRKGGGVGHDALLQHVAVDLESVGELSGVPRSHQHGFVGVFVGSAGPLIAPHIVKHAQRRVVVLRFRTRTNKRGQNVLVRLHPRLLHLSQIVSRLRQRAHLRAAGHQRGVRVLAQHEPARSQRLEKQADHAELLVVLQLRRLGDPGEQRADAHGARGERRGPHVLQQREQVALRGESRTARRHQRGHGVLVRTDVVPGHLRAQTERLGRLGAARVEVDQQVVHVAVHFDVERKGIVQHSLRLENTARLQAAADEHDDRVFVGMDVVSEELAIGMKRLFLRSEIFTLLQVYIVKEKIGN